MFKKQIVKWLDKYIEKNYSDQYIHKSMIQSEISLRIKNAVNDVNKLRDDQEMEQLNTLRVQHHIVTSGLEAELENYKKIVLESQKMRADVEELYFSLVSRIKTVAIINAENKQEGLQIINSVSSSIGRLDKISNNIIDLIEKTEDSRQGDLEKLRIKQIEE